MLQPFHLTDGENRHVYEIASRGDAIEQLQTRLKAAEAENALHKEQIANLEKKVVELKDAAKTKDAAEDVARNGAAKMPAGAKA